MMLSSEHLSVQSHVARDYVGNRAAATLLHCLGDEVDEVHTVSFASMYVHEGRIHDLQSINTIFDGLWKAINSGKGAGLVGADSKNVSASLQHNPYCTVLTGFAANPEVLSETWKRIQDLKQQTQTPIWIMDPCMGDNDALYVPSTVLEFYKKNISQADLITPNEYELYWLTEDQLPRQHSEDKEADAIKRINILHEMGCKIVILTSVTSQNGEELLTYLSDGATKRMWRCASPKRHVFIGGCGDCFNALIAHSLLEYVRTPTKFGQSYIDLEAVDWEKILGEVVGRMQAFFECAFINKWTSLKVPKLVKLKYKPVEVESIPAEGALTKDLNITHDENVAQAAALSSP